MCSRIASRSSCSAVKYINIVSAHYASEAPFSSIHFNSRSVHKNFDQISNFLNLLEFDFDVIGLSETWLKHVKDADKLPNMPGYNTHNCVCSNRCGRLGGGVGLYVKDSYTYFERPDLVNGDAFYESLLLKFVSL